MARYRQRSGAGAAAESAGGTGRQDSILDTELMSEEPGDWTCLDDK